MQKWNAQGKIVINLRSANGDGGMMNRSGPGMPGGIPPHWQFYFTVDDIEAVQKRAIDAGVKIAMPPMDVPGGSRILQATDDQGGHFALMQEPK